MNRERIQYEKVGDGGFQYRSCQSFLGRLTEDEELINSKPGGDFCRAQGD